MIRAGIVGCGGAAWVGHLPWLAHHPEIELAATCALEEEAAQRAAQRWSVPKVYTDFDAMLESESLDALVIATPPALHAPMSIAAAQRGIHVLVEKPMAMSVDECDAMSAAASSAGTVLMVSHEKRFNPGFEKVREIIDEGLLGEVFYLVVHWSASVRLDPDRLCPPDYRTSYEWRWTDESAGGGIMFDHVPHYLDLWRWWTGSELESVSAELLNVRGDLIGDTKLGGPHEDFGVALMRFSNGCIGMFETGNVGRGLSPIQNVGSATGEWSEYGMIYGTRGQLVFDLLPWDSPELPRIMVNSLENCEPSYRGWFQVEMPDPWRSPGGPDAPTSNPHYMFKRQMDHFVECIRTGTTPRVGCTDGRATVDAVRAVYESNKSGQRVAL